MEDYVPQIQERMRKAGYPLFREGEVREIRLGPDKPDWKRATRWHFDTIERKAGFVLQAASIVYHTTAYETSDAFFAALQDGLAIIDGTVGIDLFERLGLRYVNAFHADEGHGLSEYFQPGISGIALAEIGVTELRLFVNLVADTQLRVADTRVPGKLVIRLTQNTEGWFLPPDVRPLDLAVTKRLQADKTIAVMDYDHFVEFLEEVRPFSVETIVKGLRELHTVTSAAFRTTVSDFAGETWK
jgi:uncharacterized protein (TIGR04255 family)